MSSTVTFGIAPIGQPASNLRKGWLSGGIDFSHSEVDFITSNIDNMAYFTDGTLEDYKIDLLLGKAGYGIKNNWEVFAGLGFAKTDFGGKREEHEEWGDLSGIRHETFDGDGDLGHAFQIGTKATLYERALLKAGVMCQLTWLNMTGTLENTAYKDEIFISTGETELETDMMILQFAGGLSYQLSFGVSLYGGPLFQWIDGDITSSGQTGHFIGKSGSVDIEGDSSFGGWAGIKADIDIFTSLNLEYQMTGSSGTIGLSLTSKF